MPVGQRNTFNENFFDNPEQWGPKQAYWFGWMYTDGYNQVVKNNFYLRLQERDIKVIENFKRDLEFSGPVIIEKRKPFSLMGKPIKQYQNRALIRPTSKHTSQQLAKLGIVPNKSSNTGFPYWLREDLVPHFLRGVFEGDGTFSFPESWHKFECNLTANEEFLKGVDSYIQKIVPIVRRAKYTFNNGCRVFRIAGNENAIPFFNYLYENNNGLILDRKFEIFKKVYEFKIQTQNRKGFEKHLEKAKNILYQNA